MSPMESFDAIPCMGIGESLRGKSQKRHACFGANSLQVNLGPPN